MVNGGVVRVWGSDGGLSKSIPVHSGIVYCVRWSPDGKSLAVAGQGGFLGVIAGEDDKLTKAISSHEGDVLALDWSPDSKRLASGGRDKTIHITDIEKVNSDSVVVGPFDAAVNLLPLISG